MIDATPYYALELWKMRRRSADAGHLTPVPDDPDGNLLVQKLNQEFEKLQEEGHGVARWFNETRVDTRWLTTIFERVKEAGKERLEGVTLTFVYEGMEARYAKFGQRYCEQSQHEMSRPFVSTMAAIAASGVRVKEVRISDEKGCGAIGVGRLESLAPCLKSFEAAFEGLETLQLNLRDWRTPDLGFELERTRAPFVVRFLAKCTNVRTLELSCYSELEADLFREMARTCRFDRLERCRLDLFRINHISDLITFLASSSTTLVSLHLTHVLLADLGISWADIFTAITDTHTLLAALEMLKLERLFTQQANGVIKRVLFANRRLQDETSLTSSLHVEGESWRDDLIERGCQYSEAEAARMWEVGVVMYPFLGLSGFVPLRL